MAPLIALVVGTALARLAGWPASPHWTAGIPRCGSGWP